MTYSDRPYSIICIRFRIPEFLILYSTKNKRFHFLISVQSDLFPHDVGHIILETRFQEKNDNENDVKGTF